MQDQPERDPLRTTATATATPVRVDVAIGSTGDFAEAHAMLRARFDERDAEPDDSLRDMFEREIAPHRAEAERSFTVMLRTLYIAHCRTRRASTRPPMLRSRNACTRRARPARGARRRAAVSHDDGDDGPGEPAAGHALPELTSVGAIQ